MVTNDPPSATAAIDPCGDSSWLNDAAALATCLGNDAAALAIDTEFVREKTYWPHLALIQLASSGGPPALIDPLTFPDPTAIGRMLTQPGRPIVMHSAGEDLVALRPLLPEPLRGLYDTQIAGAFAGLGLGLGYQATVEQLVGVRLDKQETRSNWLLRPLSVRQIEYALDDVRHLHEIHSRLDERLHARGMRDWHREDCLRLAENGFSAEPDPQPQLALRGAWRWPITAQAQLRRILLWRDQAARERNLPRRWVLDDDTALAAAIDPAHSAARLAARLDQGPPGQRRSLQPLLDLLQGPAEADLLATTQAIAGPLEGELKQTVKRLKAEVDTVATGLDLPSSLICPRRAVESLAGDGTWPSDLLGWRSDLLRERLLPLL